MGSYLPASRNSAPRHLFVYGSLVDPCRLDDVLGHPHRGEWLRARLAGYDRATSAAYDYPYIVQAHGRSVDGVVIMDLSPQDMRALDHYEAI
jgi:gamma-glutamylcyclotransferase (GGCT)/AIG2-like uncharacterized protein YtfP